MASPKCERGQRWPVPRFRDAFAGFLVRPCIYYNTVMVFSWYNILYMELWIVFTLFYIVLNTVFTQCYKITTGTMKNASAQTVGLQLLATLSCFIFMPFFEFHWPENPWVWGLLALSCVFYAINNRMLARVRQKVEASTMSILGQVYTVFVTLAGFVLFHEEATVAKIIGAILIIAGNVLVFYQRKKTSETKYVWAGVLAYLLSSIAGLIDIDSSGQFNLALYAGFLYLIPATFIAIGGRVKPSEIRDEWRRAKKWPFVLTGFCWGTMWLSLLIAYQFGEVSVITPLSSMVVLVNVIVGYFWLHEKSNLIRKLVAAAMAIAGLILIAL